MMKNKSFMAGVILAVVLILLLSCAAWAGQGKPLRGAQLNRSHPLARGLIHCMLVNEHTGDTIHDYAQPERTLTISGASRDVDAVIFEANSQWITTDGVYWPHAGTMACIVSRSSDADNNDFLFDTMLGGGSRYLLWRPAVGKYEIMLGDTALFSQYSNYIPEICPANVGPCMFAFTWSDADNACLVYNETGLIASSTVAFAAGETVSTRYGNAISNNSFWRGGIHVSMMWDRILSPDEVALLHREPYCMFERPRSTAFYGFTQAGGSLVFPIFNDSILRPLPGVIQ